MITIRKSDERGRTQIAWLDARHSFSFGDYIDRNHHHFSVLRVINEDRVAAGGGFSPHPHKDMEIITYIIRGALAHRDSTGGKGIIKAGDVQAMSAGSGVTHSEFNASDSEPVHLLQIWIIPDKKDYTPRYFQKTFSRDEKLNTLCLIAGSGEGGNYLPIRQDAKLFASVLESSKEVQYKLGDSRNAWIQVISGELSVNKTALFQGDGAQIESENLLNLRAATDSEFLLFDLP